MQNVFAVVAALACTLITTAAASSVSRDPLRTIFSLHNVTIHTPTRRVTALSHFDLSFALNTNDHVKLTLEPNHDIFQQGALFVNVLGKDGRLVSQEPVDRLAHKVYKGKTWTRGPEDDEWTPAGWARIGLRRDGDDPLFEGVFSVDRDNHHVQMTRNYLQTRHLHDPEVDLAEHEYMIMYRDSDMTGQGLEYRDINIAGQMSCLADQMHFNTMSENSVHQEILRRSNTAWYGMSLGSLFGKRDVDPTTGGNSAGVNLVSTIGQTAGCPTTRKVALVGVAADCTYRSAFDSKNDTQSNIIIQMNTASAIYERTFDITLGLANLTIMDPDCPATPAEATPWNQACSSSFNISARLNSFSQWRGNQKDNNSHWTLLSTCATDTAVGLAWLGQACVNTAQTSGNTTVTGNGASPGAETVSGANVVIRAPGVTEWQVIAHETGHTFGAVHDCTSDTCANSQFVSSSQCCPLSSSTCDAGAKYIMNPSTSQGISDFSPCSIGNICSALGRNSVRSTCLTDNSNVATFMGQQCGNGIVEPGEECDCGGTAGCGNNTCCDPTTCKFKTGAVCDDSNESCCHSCQFASAGTVCRPSSGVCDPQEVCPGNSSSCPADVMTPNGHSCGKGLQCASGQCTSRNQQCQTVMGSYTSDNDTNACDSSGCQISCSSPSFGPGVCYEMNQNFLDGTTCGGSGTCSNGQCKGASVSGEIKSWFHDNPALAIGLCVAGGLLVLLIFLSCLWRCCCRGRRGPKVDKQTGPPPGWTAGAFPPPSYYGAGRQPGYDPPPPLEMSTRGSSGIAPPPPAGFVGRGNSLRYA
ncbi:hypothetical protein ANO11243_032970 [Dothideomycetidae sp. 11243]|nr:hypothetical protein ANO11243_032970 [fungal sp. No.11243]